MHETNAEKWKNLKYDWRFTLYQNIKRYSRSLRSESKVISSCMLITQISYWDWKFMVWVWQMKKTSTTPRRGIKACGYAEQKKAEDITENHSIVFYKTPRLL